MKNSVNSINHQDEVNSLSHTMPVYPLPPHPEQGFGKTAAFLAGVLVGAVGLATAAYFAEDIDSHELKKSSDDFLDDSADESCTNVQSNKS